MSATPEEVLEKIEEVKHLLSLTVEDLAAVKAAHKATELIRSEISQMLKYNQWQTNPEPVLRDLSTKLNDLHADAVGSWHLDKQTGIMTSYDAFGHVVAKFHLEDTESYAHKERRTDLE